MDAKDLIRAGKLSEARIRLVEEVKLSPADAGKRTLLFQVFAFLGEWDKAERQLEAIASQDPKAETAVQVYKNIVQVERERIEVSRLHRRPSFLPETPSYAENYFMALESLAGKKLAKAEKLLGEIDAVRTIPRGKLNGEDFSGFRDTDAVLSLFIEMIVYERYIWFPIDLIKEISISAPKTLFDLLWVTARVTSREGLTVNGYLPVLYPESFLHQDDRVKMGRMTDWKPLGGKLSKGSGQHVFLLGQNEIPLLEIREISIQGSKPF